MTPELKTLLIELSDLEHQIQMLEQSDDYDAAYHKELVEKSMEKVAQICNWTDENLR